MLPKTAETPLPQEKISMKRRATSKTFLFSALLLLMLSIVLAVASILPVETDDMESRVTIKDSFRLTPLETRRHGIGSFQGGENLTVSVQESMNRTVNFSILTYGGLRFSNPQTGNTTYSFIAGADYYELAFFANATTVNDITFNVAVQKPVVFYPFSWLATPAKAMFIFSSAFAILLLLKIAITEGSSTVNKINIVRIDVRIRKILVIALLASLAVWLYLLVVNAYPFATFENWYTDHVRHPYSAELFTKVGFSIFDTPLGKLATNDYSYYKFVTWPEMPHLYPLGSILLFLPFGFMLESGVMQGLVFKMEIAIFLLVSHVCLYYFLKYFWEEQWNFPLKILNIRLFWQEQTNSTLKALGAYLLYILLVVYSANGMFDTVAFFFSLMGMILYFKGRYDYFLLFAVFSLTLKYQAGIFLFPLIILGVLKLARQSKISGIIKNKVVLVASALAGVDVITAYLSAPFLLAVRPELVMNGVNAFSPHSQIPWSLQAFAVLLTLLVTIISALYLLHKNSLVSLFMVFSLLPSFLMPYFQPWYLSFFFIYMLFPTKKKASAVAMFWLIFMTIVLSFGGLAYNPILIIDNIRRILKF